MMAAEGRSNPEIAQALFITKKTVEAHLASVYRKLAIHSRRQLEFALRGSNGAIGDITLPRSRPSGRTATSERPARHTLRR
jgi:hypothetical protein